VAGRCAPRGPRSDDEDVKLIRHVGATIGTSLFSLASLSNGENKRG
jgi:hypothetical protein